MPVSLATLLAVGAVVPHEEHALQLQSAYTGWCSTTWAEYGAPGRIAQCIPCNGASDCPPGKSCWSVAYCTLDSAWVNIPCGASSPPQCAGPAASPPPPPFVRTVPTQPALIRGFYQWTWGPGSTGPSSANSPVSFSGHFNITLAIRDEVMCPTYLPPTAGQINYLSLGGGNAMGRFTVSNINAITRSVCTLVPPRYQGIMFDVEEAEGPASALVPAFAAAFAAAKSCGFAVAVTTSHTAPYHVATPDDAIALVNAWVTDTNIDILSPQLYTTGNEAAPDFGPTFGTWRCSSPDRPRCDWTIWRNSHAAFVPSIVDETHLDATVAYFATQGITMTRSFFQWRQ